MKEYDRGFERKFDFSSAELSYTKIPQDTKYILDMEKEDQQFTDDYKKWVDNPLLKHADDMTIYDLMEE